MDLDIYKEIEALNRISSEDEPYESLREKITEIIRSSIVPAGQTRASELFFRVTRPHNGKPLNLTDIGPPPPPVVRNYQRCNPPQEPRLYVASNRWSALREARILPGETVYMSHWIGNSTLPIILMFDEVSCGHSPCPIRLYADTLFTRRVHSDFSSDYKLTSAISEVLMTGWSGKRLAGVDKSKMIGLRYPSVLNHKGAYNTVFPAHFALERMELLSLLELKVSDSIGNQKIEVTDVAESFEGGRIKWSGNCSLVPTNMQSGGAANFLWRDGKWRLPTLSESDLDLTALFQQEKLNQRVPNEACAA